MQPVQGVTTLSLSAFVPPPGSYYNYASFYNPAGTFRRLVPPMSTRQRRCWRPGRPST